MENIEGKPGKYRTLSGIYILGSSRATYDFNFRDVVVAVVVDVQVEIHSVSAKLLNYLFEY